VDKEKLLEEKGGRESFVKRREVRNAILLSVLVGKGKIFGTCTTAALSVNRRSSRRRVKKVLSSETFRGRA